jgi:hypothetical protein
MMMGSAFADERSWSDSVDSKGALDIETYSQSHLKENSTDCLVGCPTRLITHTVKMYEPWENDIITGGDRTNVIFYFDTVGGNGTGYDKSVLLGLNDDGSLYARMVKFGKHNNRTVGYVRVWRPDDRSVSIAFPRKALMTSGSTYHWSVDTYYQEDGTVCENSVHCTDSTLRVRHQLH